MKGINIFLADGFEDVEALAVNDVLRRAGLQTKLVSINSEKSVCSSHSVCITADCTLEQIDFSHTGTEEKDVMIFPGGMPGTKNLAACKELIELMNAHYSAGGSVAAICAAPGLVLSQLTGVCDASFTCFEGFQKHLSDKDWTFCRRPSHRSGRIITGRSAGFALDFGFEILRAITDEDTVCKVQAGVFSWGV